MENFLNHGQVSTDLSLAHLQAELSRLDLLIQRQVRRWQLAGQDPADAFRGLHLSEAEAEALLARPFGHNWGETISLPPAEVQVWAELEAAAGQQVEQLVQVACQQKQSLRLLQLAETFDLDRFELDVLLVCLAPTLDLRYERLYGYLQDDVTRKRPTVNLALDLLTEPGSSRLLHLAHFSDDSPLFKFRLLERSFEPGGENSPLLSQTLHLDQAIVAWLLGRYQPQAGLGPHAALFQLPAEPDQTDLLLAGEVAAELLQVAATNPPPLVVFYGPDQASQQAAARVLAIQLGRPLLLVDLTPLTKNEQSPLHVVRLVLRDARLTGAVPCLLGWDACLVDQELSPGLLAELSGHPSPVIVAGQCLWQARGIERARPMLWFEFPVPAYNQRCALWQHFLQANQLTNQLDISALAGQFVLTTGQIRDVVNTACDQAMQRGAPLTTDDLLLAARAHSNPRLANLARKIAPRYDWADIILPADQLAILHEIIATVRGRPLVLEEWGVGEKLASSAGVTVLFAGPPGTGKTMAAEIIAHELGLDLYKIDLSTIVSKYIGETEKNLEKIFSEAQSSNAILFFDEADAIFGKRSEVKDAHDRYANIEVSYLLQRMEAYDGVTILATNLRANLDEAFTRRLQFAVDFPFPEVADRQRIWETLFPPAVPRQPDLDFGLLARRFKLAGGNIRNVIVSAAYLAAADGEIVTMDHLLHGIRRELQKMGRLVNEADLEIGKKQPLTPQK